MPFGLAEEEADGGPRAPSSPMRVRVLKPPPALSLLERSLAPPADLGPSSPAGQHTGMGWSPGGARGRERQDRPQALRSPGTSPLTGGLSDRHDLPTRNILSEKVFFWSGSHSQHGSSLVCLGSAGSNTVPALDWPWQASPGSPHRPQAPCARFPSDCGHCRLGPPILCSRRGTWWPWDVRGLHNRSRN